MFTYLNPAKLFVDDFLLLTLWLLNFHKDQFGWEQLCHNVYISFWIPRRQAISTDTSFEIKMMVKTYAIEIIFKSHKPFQSYLLTGQADSAKKAG